MTQNILILCTGNSCRSIMAEAIINRKSAGRYTAFSAGSRPVGKVSPHTIALLKSKGYDTIVFRSKSWDEFSKPGAPALDFVITVCGNADSETCPVWIGAPMSAHWGIADPARAKGTEAEVLPIYARAYDLLETRIDAFLALRPETMLHGELRAALTRIGNMEGAA